MIDSSSPVVVGTGVGECLAVIELLFELDDVGVCGDPDQVGLTFNTGDRAGVAGVPDCSVDPSFELVRDAVGGRDALLTDVAVPGEWVGEFRGRHRGETGVGHGSNFTPYRHINGT
jgi:hypothetical protein